MLHMTLLHLESSHSCCLHHTMESWLWQQLSSAAASAVVAARGPGLVAASPAGPVQHGLRWGQAADHQPIDQPTDLGHGQRDQFTISVQLGQERPP
jgi:hypothetical protein